MAIYKLGELFCGPGGLAWGATNADIGLDDFKIDANEKIRVSGILLYLLIYSRMLGRTLTLNLLTLLRAMDMSI